MSKQDFLDFTEAFLTVMFAGGVVHTVGNGTTFPGWYPIIVELVPTLGLATLAGIRRINAGHRSVDPQK
jgi:hypothetical protein